MNSDSFYSYQDIVLPAHSLNNFSCLVFDLSFNIQSANDKFQKEVGISTFDLKAFRISNFSQNTFFVNLLQKVLTENYAVFSGLLFLCNAQEYEVENCICMLKKGNSDVESYILCIFTQSIKPLPVSGFSSSVPTSGIPTSVWLPAISIHAEDGRLVYLSESIEALLGYSYSELLKNNPYDPVYVEDRELVKNTLSQLMLGEKTVSTRYRMVHNDGHIVNVETVSYKIDDVSKKASYIVNVTYNMSEAAQVQLKLRQSEEKYQKLIMSMPIGIVLFSPQGKILEINESMRQIMKFPEASALSDFDFFAFKPMQESGVPDSFHKCLQTKQIVNGEVDYPLNGEQSTYIYLRYSFMPHLDSDNNVVGVIGNILNLSELRKVEIENKRQGDFLNKVINSLSTPFFVKDEEHKWVILNDAFLKLVGHTREEILGKSDFNIFPKEQAEVFWEMDKRVFLEGSTTNEEDITDFDKSVRKLLTNKSLYHEKFTNKKFIVGFSYDITDFKKVESDLRQSKEKYQQLFENANDFIVTIDMAGAITNVNKKVSSYFGQSKESILGMHIRQYVHVDDLPKIDAIKEKVLHGEDVPPVEIRAFNVENKLCAYEVKVSLIHNNSAIDGFQVIFSDITQRYEASRNLEKYTVELQELNETKDKFFSIIAHDLRSPYSSIIGFAELIIDDIDSMTKSEILDYISIIKNSAKNSLNLLDNLLTWSRLETNRLPFTPEWENLKSVADEVISVLYSLAFRKNINIDNTIDENIVEFCDKNMINTILHNLVMNSIKFTQMGGAVVISAERVLLDNKKWTKITVADTGIGMDEKIIHELLNSPRPSSRLGTNRETGTGLGIILSREMAERHGGKIVIISELGKGSLLSILLPVVEKVNQ